MIQRKSSAEDRNDPGPPCRATADTRRRDILGAARECVHRAGFHGAGMATIARSAGLSVGQLYRYFENKEAIVAAMVAQDLADIRERFDRDCAAVGSFAQAVVQEIPMAVARGYDPARGGLVLEVCAEAARNSKIKAIVQRLDAEERARCHERLRSQGDQHGLENPLDVRLEVVALLFDGMAVRAVSNPDIDQDALAAVLAGVVRQLLDPS